MSVLRTKAAKLLQVSNESKILSLKVFKRDAKTHQRFIISSGITATVYVYCHNSFYSKPFFRYIDGGPPAGEPDMSSSIWRRYSEFEMLRNYLVATFPAVRKSNENLSQ